MIVKILSRGKSFKGLATYLTRDPDAKTDERVAWTHTRNLAHDEISSAVDTMLWTARNAELLKQEAGIRAGGRSTENAVKHLSLDWAPDQAPTREHMIEAADGFLTHMGWQEHQALLVAHNDKAHAHVHVMLNVIHPETGLRLDDNFERRRAQSWALDYERTQGRIYCEQRLENAEVREDAPTRPAWMAFQQKEQEFARDEKLRRDQEPILIRELEIPENSDAAEWKSLKQMQRLERQCFFAEGKIAFSELRGAIYREVREEFRERWSDYYAAQENNTDPETLAKIKAGLIADQACVLGERRDAACTDLRESRDDQYRILLDEQREIRLGLTWRQEAGLENELFLNAAADRHAPQDVTEAFREAAEATTVPRDRQEWREKARDFAGDAAHQQSGLKSGTDVGAGFSIGVGFGLLDILGGIADGLVWSKPDPKPRQPPPELPVVNPFGEKIIEEARHRQRCEQEEADRAWRLKQRGNDGI